MAEKVYECMFILNANAYARNPGNASGGIQEIVGGVGGELLASRMYIEQKLAYPIKGHRKGVYWLSYVRLNGDVLPKFNRACQLNDMMLRHLIISIDPRLVDTLVAAASETRPVVSTRIDSESVRDVDNSDDDSDNIVADSKAEVETAVAE